MRTYLWLTVLLFPPLTYPGNQFWLPIIESETLLLQHISNSTGKMESQPCRHPEQTLGICKYLASQVSSIPRQRGVTEFLPNGGVLSLTLMDKGWVHHPNVTPSRYPMKFWGLFGMVAPIAHTTQKHFLIGPFAKPDSFHWSRHILCYLNLYPFSPDDISTTYTSYTYIFNKHLTFVVCIFWHMLPKVQYNWDIFL